MRKKKPKSTRENLIKRYEQILDTQGDTLGRLLQKALNASNQRLLSPNPFQEFDLELNPSQSQLLQVLCLKGSTAQELATRLKISKQATGHIVGELEELGLLKRRTNPKDARAKLIQHTPKGFALVSKLLERTIAIEETYSKLLGSQQYIAFKKSLEKIGKIE